MGGRMSIRENFLKIKKEVPEYVKIVLAAKTRTKDEIEEVISAGAEIIGENYVQEALQKNKINKALRIFDCIQTVDSSELAEAINKRAHNLNKKISVFIEINIGSEITKAGVKPEYEIIKKLAEYISKLNYLKLEGLMTMGPRVGNPEDVRVHFRKTKEFFNRLKGANIPNVELKYLSMGMSNSYRIAIQEGANMINFWQKTI